MLENSIYHAAVVTGLAIGYAKFTKLRIKSTKPPWLTLDGYDTGIVILDVGLAMYMKDMLVHILAIILRQIIQT